jgi:hypothetical protein
MKLALVFLAIAVPAAAQQSDGGVPSDLQKELEQAIEADKAATQQAQRGQPAPAAATAPSSGSAPQTLLRGAQSLNPDFSVILDADTG